MVLCEEIGLATGKNHTEACQHRREAELNKTSDGQDRLDSAKDRLDTRAVEIGQAELEKEENDQQGDPVPQQKQNPEGAGEAGEGGGRKRPLNSCYFTIIKNQKKYS